MRSLVIAAVAALGFSVPAVAAGPVDLQPYVNANVSTYTEGGNYPSASTTIGGVTFSLATFDGGTGIVQLDGTNAVNIAVNQTGVNTAYVILNSAFGIAGQTIGSLVFNGGGNSVSFDLTEGVNVRDHFFGFFNNSATDIFATAAYTNGGIVADGPNFAHFDVYRFDISALGGALDSIDFGSRTDFFANGQPFLAGVTTAFTVGGVPEVSTWAMLIFGMGAAGAALRRRSVRHARTA